MDNLVILHFNNLCSPEREPQLLEKLQSWSLRPQAGLSLLPCWDAEHHFRQAEIFFQEKPNFTKLFLWLDNIDKRWCKYQKIIFLELNLAKNGLYLSIPKSNWLYLEDYLTIPVDCPEVPVLDRPSAALDVLRVPGDDSADLDLLGQMLVRVCWTTNQRPVIRSHDLFRPIRGQYSVWWMRILSNLLFGKAWVIR